MRSVIKRLGVVAVLIMSSMAYCVAQNDFEMGYDYLYTAANRVKVRKVVTCSRDNQQLWNGDHVRRMNGMICIYRNSVCITCGYQVWLEHTGYYTVAGEDGEQHLVTANGQPTGVYGEELVVLWNGIVCVYLDGVFFLSTADNHRLGTIYSDQLIEIYHNGYYCYHQGAYYLVATPEGQSIRNAYSDVRPELIEGDYWRCKKNGKVFFVDTKGKVYR